jgi:preprotein translocase subunit SecE
MNKVRLYIEDAANELLNKVTWPTWAELQNSAIVVMVASLIIALTIALMDFVFRGSMEILYKMLFS